MNLWHGNESYSCAASTHADEAANAFNAPPDFAPGM